MAVRSRPPVYAVAIAFVLQLLGVILLSVVLNVSFITAFFIGLAVRMVASNSKDFY